MKPELRNRFSNLVDFYIKVPCGRCALCKERISKEWKVRLTVECRNTDTHYHLGKCLPRVLFVTLTFAEEHYKGEEEFDFAPYLKKFRDNFRKAYGRSPRYFAITDRGSQFGRLHLHILLFNPRVWSKEERRYTALVSNSQLHKKRFWWPYGFVDSQWVENPNVAGYVCGYITGANLDREEPVKHGKPICEKALRYKPQIYPSKGLGSAFLTEENMDEIYRTDARTLQLDGFHYALPRYYVNKIFHQYDLIERRSVQFAEQYDYWQRVRFGEAPLVYDYKGMPITPSHLAELVEFREKFVTPAKEKVKPKAIFEVDGVEEFIYPVLSGQYVPDDYLCHLDMPKDFPF